MGWAIYRGTELIQKGDDSTRTVIDYTAAVPVERPYTPVEDTTATEQKAASDAYALQLEQQRQAFLNALAAPGRFESVEGDLQDHYEAIDQNRQNLATANSELDTLKNVTIPALESDLGVVDDKATQAKAAADNAVTGTVVEYTHTSSPTIVPDNNAPWSPDTPNFVMGLYYWMRTIVTYGSGAVTTTDPILVTGPKGDTGEGDPGIGIDHIDVEYYQSLAPDSLVGGAWSTVAPVWYSGLFIWTRTKTYYTDNSESESNPVNITGSSGSSGIGIVSFKEQYYLSTSQDSLVGGEWVDIPPAWSEGKYYWTRSVLVFTDESIEVTDPIMVSGGKGATGSDGISVTSVTPFFRLVITGASAPGKPSGTGDPSGWTKTEPDYTAQRELYRTERILFSNGSVSWTDVTKVASFTAVVSLTTKLDANASVIEDLQNNIIPALEDDLADNESKINTLENTTLPALQSSLATTAGRIDTVENTTIPNLNTRISDAETDWAELENTTLPGITSRLTVTEATATNAASAAATAQTAADNAAADAVTKSAAAEAAAKAHAEAEAEAARLAAIAAASSDAEAKANAAEAAAIVTAAADALTKANAAEAAAKAHAEDKASQAQAAAISAAETDATAKANTARLDAIAAAALDATTKADAAQTAAEDKAAIDAQAKADAVTSWVQSRGTDLVTNGTGYLGDNTNFSTFTFDGSDSPEGTRGSFDSEYGRQRSSGIDELIPISSTSTYLLKAFVKQKGNTDEGRFYIRLSYYTSWGDVLRRESTRTSGDVATLTQDLNPGDTVIHVDTTNGWRSGDSAAHLKYIGIWGLPDPTGKVWPEGVATFNHISVGPLTSINNIYVGLTENSVQLRGPYSGVALPAGTRISNMVSGDTEHFQLAGNAVAPSEWTEWSGLVSGSDIPPPAAAVKITLLSNWGDIANSQVSFAGVSFSDTTAAQVMAEDARALATTADGKADAAQTAANNATSLIDTVSNAVTNAQSAADMAAKILHTSTSAPTVADGEGRPVGAQWTRVDASNNEIGYWRWTGSTWVVESLGTQVIPNLSASKITSGTISTARLNAADVAAHVATVIQLNADRITSGEITAGQINAVSIAGAVATYLNLRADQITSGQIDADMINVANLAVAIADVIALNAGKITSGTIDTARLNAQEIATGIATIIQLNASRITTGTISGARLDFTEIAANVASIIEINADQITSGQIDAGQINASSVAAAVASFLTLEVSQLRATSGTFDAAVINKIWTDVVRANKITTDMLLVGQGENLVPNGSGQLTSNSGFTAWTWTTSSRPAGALGAFQSTTSGQKISNEYFILEPSTEYVLSVWVNAASSSAMTFDVKQYNNSSTSALTDPTLVAIDPTPEGNGTTGNVSTTWVERKWSFVTAATTSRGRVAVTHAAVTQRIANIRIQKRISTSLIVDGGILSRHLSTGLVSAEHVAVGGLRPENFAFGIDEMIPNPNFSNADLIAKDLFALEGAGIQYNATAPRPSGSVRRLAFLASAAPYDYNTSSGTRARLTDYVPAKRGDMFYLEATLVRNSTSSSATRWAIRAEFFDASKAYVGHVDVETPPQSELLTLYPILNTEFKISGMIEAPENTSFVRIVFVKTEVGTGTTAVLYVSARRAMAGTNSLGARSILSPEGLQIYAVGSEIGADPDIDLTSTQQGLLMRDESQEPTIQLTRAGSVYARHFEVADSLEYRGNDLEQVLWNLPRGLLLQAESPTGDITNITSELGIIESGTFWFEGGRMYKVRVEFAWSWAGSASEVQSRVRYTSSMSTTPGNPTVSSTVMTNTYQFQPAATSGWDKHEAYEATFWVGTGASEYRRLLVTINRNGGTGTISNRANANGGRRMRMFVYDLGPTWRDGHPTYQWVVLPNNGGGTTVAPPTSRTLTINSIGAGTWNAAGNKSTYSLYVNNPTQGPWSGTNYRGGYFFSDSDLQPVRGAVSIDDVQIYLTNVQTGDGTAQVGAYGSSAANGTNPWAGAVGTNHGGNNPVYGSGGVSAGWRSLNPHNDWKTNLRTVALYADNAPTNYSRYGTSAQLKITYTK